jgi:hypothetical protein
MRAGLSLAALAILMTALGPLAYGQTRIEVSADGRQSVIVTPAGHESGPPMTAGRGVPYGTTPDWQNTLRRQVSSLALADVNGDGWPDLVVGCYHSDSYPPYPDWENLIYYNTGGQLEANPSWVSTDEVSTVAIAVGDINKDGYPDIFAGNGDFAMSPSVIYFGEPGGPSPTPGWYSTVPGQTWVTGVALCDVNHDGYLDVAIANEGVSPNPFRPIYLFRNFGGNLETTPGWQSATSSIQSAVAFGDYNNDGWEDLAVSLWDNGFPDAIYKNNNGTLATTPVWTTGFSATDKGVAWADVDHNGWLDLAIGHSPTLLYSNNNGVLTQSWSSQASYFGQQDLKFCDVNGDGWADLAEVNFSDGQTHIYLNHNGVLDGPPTWTYDSSAVGTALAFGDINGDGRPDLAIGYSGQPCIVVFYAQPPPILYGDMNCDSTVNFADINPFVQYLADTAGWQAAHPGCPLEIGDINQDGTYPSFADINPFVALIVGS